ncbi:MAG: class I SAM-dependent methyltransferase [Elstera sp.]|jgi:2-polyprenyl-3-methyl-5-hydroxy-6-metoxy-1,4-benzoquinol methylase|uniref:class I SAM-dependent methyltransferase n=1 Tax=Elstera sp. TaxID=1916664 RepID=UPI0037C0E163
MITEDTQKNWEEFGKNNPYYGVNTAEIYRGSELDAEKKRRFFAQGIAHITALMQGPIAARHAGRFGTAVDFGVGVGRLAIPLSAYADQVWGVDIAQSMLDRAARHAEEAGVTPLKLCRSVQELPQGVDFVHSYIVIQHIPVEVGEQIILGLYDKLKLGGIGALHVPIADARAPMKRYAALAQKYITPLRYLFNLLRGAPLSDPVMQMNIYDLNRLSGMLLKRGAVNLQLVQTPSAWEGVYLIFTKGAGADAGKWWTPEAEGKA